MPSIARACSHCKRYSSLEVSQPFLNLSCPFCSQSWGTITGLAEIFDACPICQCKQFYTQKDFNQVLGCLVMAIGITLVPWTYGLSLPVFAGVDWLLYERVPTIAVCYRCDTEFRGFPLPKRLKLFMHHIGMKYDKMRDN